MLLFNSSRLKYVNLLFIWECTKPARVTLQYLKALSRLFGPDFITASQSHLINPKYTISFITVPESCFKTPLKPSIIIANILQMSVGFKPT